MYVIKEIFLHTLYDVMIVGVLVKHVNKFTSIFID